MYIETRQTHIRLLWPAEVVDGEVAEVLPLVEPQQLQVFKVPAVHMLVAAAAMAVQLRQIRDGEEPVQVGYLTGKMVAHTEA
jgi:hypothetical protein